MKKFMFAAIAAMVMVSVSNVFASSRIVGNVEVAPVDTVAPDAPSDTTEVGTPIQPQATTEDSTQQETPGHFQRRDAPGQAAQGHGQVVVFGVEGGDAHFLGVGDDVLGADFVSQLDGDGIDRVGQGIAEAHSLSLIHI